MWTAPRTQILGSDRAQQIAEKLSLSGRIDIYYAFLVYTKNVLKSSGVAGYITSNKFLTIKSGNAVRNYMLQNYQLHRITDLGDTKLFSASVLPCIIVFSNGKTEDRADIAYTSVYEKIEGDSEKCISGIFDAIYDSGVFQIADGRKYNFQQDISKYRWIYLALAIANSHFIEKYYDVKFNTKLYSGKRRYMTQYVEQFPIPYYRCKLAQKAISIVKK